MKRYPNNWMAKCLEKLRDEFEARLKDPAYKAGMTTEQIQFRKRFFDQAIRDYKEHEKEKTMQIKF